MWLSMIEVFNKYVVTNRNWSRKGRGSFGENVTLLDNSTTLGQYMHYSLVDLEKRYMSGEEVYKSVYDDIKSFNSVERYYVREMIPKALFRLFSGISVEDNVFNDAWKMYNRDPWDRRFPNFVNGTVQEGYNKMDYSDKLKYGYWVYYKNRVVSSDYADDVKHNIRYINEAPLLILHTTTIEGVAVACLDVVGKIFVSY